MYGVPDSNFPNPARAGCGWIYELKSDWTGAGAGFENQHKTTPEPERVK